MALPGGLTTKGDAGEHLSDSRREVFNRIVERFWDPVMRYLWRRLGADEAEDLAQEVFVSVYRTLRRGTGRTPENDEGWRRYLIASARNHLANHRRRTCSGPADERLEDLLDEECTSAVISDPGEAATVGDAVISCERREAIRDCMSRLDRVSFTVCLLHFVDGRSKRDIGRALERPESSIRYLLVRALQTLRACLKEKGFAPET
ncbi:MAG: sigma-70 family RNA polymerase sigma factor [Planctomycetota bacterium]